MTAVWRLTLTSESTVHTELACSAALAVSVPRQHTSRGAAAPGLMALGVATAAVAQLLWDGAHWGNNKRHITFHGCIQATPLTGADTQEKECDQCSPPTS